MATATATKNNTSFIGRTSLEKDRASLEKDCLKDNVGTVHTEKNGLVYESSSSQIVRCHLDTQDTDEVEFATSAVDTSVQTGRYKDVAMKCLNHSCPSSEGLACLNNEYYILTRYLANCNSSVRKAIGRSSQKMVHKKSGEGDKRIQQLSEVQHAIYLEWIDGITLQNLIEQWQGREKTNQHLGSGSNKTSCLVDHLLVVQLMLKIAMGLAEIHEAGVVHNDIDADNIIVDFGTSSDGDAESITDAASMPVIAKIIDFGYASTMAMAETDDTGETVNDDLYSLGVIYCSMLLATHPSDSTRNSLKRVSISRIGDDILPHFVPNSLQAVVSCLACCNTYDSVSNQQYKSAKEVSEDLEQMLDDPENFLYEEYKTMNKNPSLVFKSHGLYGRSNEVKKLLNSYQQIYLASSDNGSEDHAYCRDIVLIAGYGGSGKTTLARSLRDPVIKSGGYFVSGKFDALQRNVPFSALINALAELCDAILASDDDTTEKIRTNIISAVGSEGLILTELIPNLNKILKGYEGEKRYFEDHHTCLTGTNTQNKLNFVFRRFMRAVTTNEHPVVMVLDDLQWADKASLHLIQSIVTDTENYSPFLLVGCYRDNEVDKNHPLLGTVHDIERLKYIPSKRKINVIKIGNLPREDINSMISDALLTKRRITRQALTDLVYQKTDGNTLFTVQFLKSLVDDKLLFFHSEAKIWQWSEDEIRLKTISNSVVDLLAHKIRTRLQENARHILKVAACIGSTFEFKILALVVNDAAREMVRSKMDPMQVQCSCDNIDIKDDNLSEILHQLVSESLIEQIDSTDKYQFAHDRVRQAAYECIPEAEREVMHNQIGERLWTILNPPENQQGILNDNTSLLFIMTDQLNKGSNLISDVSKKLSLAQLNLGVGELCMKKSAFQTALTHFEAGLRLVDQDYFWQNHYSLVLRLHNITAEAQYSTGNLNVIAKTLEKIFIHAKSFSDKLDAFSTQMLILGAQRKQKDALKIGLDVLEMMGENFPSSKSKRTVLVELIRTKWMLEKRTKESLLELPLMTDERKVTIMHFLSTIVSYCVACDPLLFPLVVCRMIRLSISHGICGASAFSFSLFGSILCDKLGKTKDGYEYGQLALSLLSKCDGKEWHAKVHCFVWGSIGYWTEKQSLTIEPLMNGHRIGMEVGDIEYANICVMVYLRDSLFCGESLVFAEKKARVFCHQIAECNHEVVLRNCVLVWQTMLNLLGKSGDPEKLTGEAMEFGTCLSTEESQQTELHEAQILFFEMYLAYMFGRSTLAAEKSEGAQKILSKSNTHQPRMVHNLMFYDGLINIDMAHSTGRKKWRVKARKNMKELKKVAKKSPQNYLDRYYLIQAEYATLRGKTKKATRAYNLAISASSEAGFCHHDALSYERTAVFFKKEGNEERAAQCFLDAHQCYLKWGAQAKADHLYDKWMT